MERQREDHARRHPHPRPDQPPDSEARHRPPAGRMPPADQVALQEPPRHQLGDAAVRLHPAGVPEGIKGTVAVLVDSGDLTVKSQIKNENRMTTNEIIKAICEIKDAQTLGKIAHKTMARACQLEETLVIDSDSEFRKNGKFFLKTIMHFEMEIINEEEEVTNDHRC